MCEGSSSPTDSESPIWTTERQDVCGPACAGTLPAAVPARTLDATRPRTPATAARRAPTRAARLHTIGRKGSEAGTACPGQGRRGRIGQHVAMTTVDEHVVTAFNTATASTNKIHDDDVARQYGFHGGLVPGVDVYAYLTHLPVRAWG